MAAIPRATAGLLLAGCERAVRRLWLGATALWVVGAAMTMGPWATAVGVVLIYVGLAVIAVFLVRCVWVLVEVLRDRLRS